MWCICRKYNARVWTVFVAALTLLGAEVSDTQRHIITLPAGKTLSIEVTVGSVRIEGSDRTDAEIIIERHAPAAALVVGGVGLAERATDLGIVDLQAELGGGP